MTDAPKPPKPLLRDRGQIYVTLAAAEQYAEARGLRIEEARRELTELLVRDARGHAGAPGDAALYRARSRQTGVDITARVVEESGLLVVVSCSARDADATRRRIIR